MVGSDPAMLEVYRLVHHAARTTLPVAIVGETGTGKELVARALHELSSRRAFPFVAVNAAALPEALFESELFGHARGAFSDARREKVGLLEAAHRGTFFCDELPALSAACQAKLLRAVEEGMVRRVGDLTPRPATPRWVISCQSFEAGRRTGHGIREDLWHRVSGVIIVLPPLRHRRDDIPVLVNHFLAEHEFPEARIQQSAVKVLIEDPWPGNVRELRQVVARLVLAADGTDITAAAARAELSTPSDPRDARQRAALQQALLAHEWNVVSAARALGISRGTLYRRLRAFGLERPC
jgi:DNA-binding NtrC family response regulator